MFLFTRLLYDWWISLHESRPRLHLAMICWYCTTKAYKISNDSNSANKHKKSNDCMHNENNSAANISPYLLFMIIISYIRICSANSHTDWRWLHYTRHYKHVDRFCAALCDLLFMRCSYIFDLFNCVFFSSIFHAHIRVSVCVWVCLCCENWNSKTLFNYHSSNKQKTKWWLSKYNDVWQFSGKQLESFR